MYFKFWGFFEGSLRFGLRENAGNDNEIVAFCILTANIIHFSSAYYLFKITFIVIKESEILDVYTFIVLSFDIGVFLSDGIFMPRVNCFLFYVYHPNCCKK